MHRLQALIILQNSQTFLFVAFLFNFCYSPSSCLTTFIELHQVTIISLSLFSDMCFLLANSEAQPPCAITISQFVRLQKEQNFSNTHLFKLTKLKFASNKFAVTLFCLAHWRAIYHQSTTFWKDTNQINSLDPLQMKVFSTYLMPPCAFWLVLHICRHSGSSLQTLTHISI